MINPYEYTDKKKGYLNEELRKLTRTIEVPEDIDKEDYKEFIKMINEAHLYAVSDKTFRKNLSQRANSCMERDLNEYDRYIYEYLIDVYKSKVVEFIFVVSDDYNEVIKDEPIGALKSMLHYDACDWVFKLLRKIQEIFISEGILRVKSKSEMYDEWNELEEMNRIADIYEGYPSYED